MNARKRAHGASWLPVIVLLSVQACSDGPTGGAHSSALAPDGALQSSLVAGGTAEPAVLVTDNAGRPQSGVQVSFEVTAGGGSLAAATVATDASGRAAARWTLGTRAGTNTLVARARGSDITFTISGVPDVPASLQVASPAAELAAAGGVVAGPPAVRVVDRYENGVPGVRVEFSADRGGSVAVPAAWTDAAGLASPGEWRTGPAEGDQVLTARVEGLGPLTFRTRVTPAAEAGVTMTAIGGDQTTCPTGSSGCGFSVRVTRGGLPVQGEAIRWTDSDGTTTTTVSNAQGLSTAANLGRNTQSGAFTQTARLVATGQELAFRYSLVPAGGFSIDLRFLASVSPAVSAAFQQAKARWEQVITGNLPSAMIGAGVVAENACGITHPAIQETVDDLLILVQVVPIDGPGKVLGSAGPCLLRTSSGLPILGVIRLDSEDLELMSANGTLRDVVLHEIGHVLGLGTLWSRHDLVQGAGSNDPLYSGARAQPGFILGGGTPFGGVPVENTGGSGTRDSHWRESTLRHELMTGWINNGTNPLSAITIGSLMDLGYQVNFGAADAFTLQAGTAGALGLSTGAHELIELPLPPPRVAH